MNTSSGVSAVDSAIILGSLLAVYAAGWYGASRARKAGSDFILAGRTLSLPFFVASLVATWYGSVLGSGEFIMRYGVMFVFCFGVPYYVAAAVYARWVAGRIRSSSAVSIPDQIGVRYGAVARRVAAIIMLVITIPASYQLMLGQIVQTISGLSLESSLVLSTTVSLAYVYRGGLRSDVYANVVQMILMYGAMLALVIFSISTFGTPSTMLLALPETTTSVPGTLGWWPVVVWFVIALQTFVDPNIHVRCAAAADGNTAKIGLYLSIAAWMVFDVLQLVAGLYAVAFVGWVPAQETYLQLAQAVLPVAWKGVFFAGIIAAVMSTLDGYALVSATTISHDVIGSANQLPWGKPTVRFGLALTGVLGIAAALLLPSVIDLLYLTASIVVPALLVPLLLSLQRKFAPRGTKSALYQMILPAAAATAAAIYGGAEPMIIGFIAAAIVLPCNFRVHAP